MARRFCNHYLSTHSQLRPFLYSYPFHFKYTHLPLFLLLLLLLTHPSMPKVTFQTNQVTTFWKAGNGGGAVVVASSRKVVSPDTHQALELSFPFINRKFSLLKCSKWIFSFCIILGWARFCLVSRCAVYRMASFRLHFVYDH